MDIEVVFTNITQLHSSAPGTARVNIEKKFVSDPTAFPCVRTRHMPVVGTDGGQGAPKSVDVPIVPANTLRHVLRVGMLTPIFDQFRGKHTLSVGSYAAAYAGSPSGNPDGIVPTYDEILAVRQHPFLGMFGGGPRMITGKLSVDSAWPITPITLPYLGSHEEYVFNGQLTSVDFNNRKDPVLSMPDEDLELVMNAPDVVTEWHTQFVGGGKTEDEARGLRSYAAHEFARVGINWLWRISAHRPTPAQSGLLLQALSALERTRIGGMGRVGYGKIKLKSLNVNGRELWGGHGLLDDDEALSWIQAWADTLDSLSPAAFESFAATRKGSLGRGAESEEGA